MSVHGHPESYGMKHHFKNKDKNKGVITVNSTTFLYLSCILAGFALIRVPLSGFLEPLEPLTFLIGVLAVILFSIILLYNGLMTLLGKRKI